MALFVRRWPEGRKAADRGRRMEDGNRGTGKEERGAPPGGSAVQPAAEGGEAGKDPAQGGRVTARR